LARFEVVKTVLRSTQANDAVIVGDVRHRSHGSRGRVGLHAGSLRAGLYVDDLAAISLARLEVVKTKVSCIRATDAIMLADVCRGSRGRAGPHGGSLHATVVLGVVRRGSIGRVGLHVGSLGAAIILGLVRRGSEETLGYTLAASIPASSLSLVPQE
jgi:hypothetical protein